MKEKPMDSGPLTKFPNCADKFSNSLLQKSKQSDISIRVLLPYDSTQEKYILKLKEDSHNRIKIQYIRGEKKPNQIVLLVDNEFVLSITLGKNESNDDIEFAVYSNKEWVVLCYINMIEYQSLVSEM